MYHMQHLLGDFNAEVPIIADKSLHKGNNDNGISVLNFASSKNLIVKSTRQHYITTTFINFCGLQLMVLHIIR